MLCDILVVLQSLLPKKITKSVICFQRPPWIRELQLVAAKALGGLFDSDARDGIDAAVAKERHQSRNLQVSNGSSSRQQRRPIRHRQRWRRNGNWWRHQLRRRLGQRQTKSSEMNYFCVLIFGAFRGSPRDVQLCEYRVFRVLIILLNPLFSADLNEQNYRLICREIAPVHARCNVILNQSTFILHFVSSNRTF